MAVIGSAQTVNIVISILRMKVLAILLGPSGVGLLSIYNSLQSMVGTAAGLGMGSSGVRQIARAKGEEQELSRVRRVLLIALLVQGVLAMLGVWLLRGQISEWLFADRSYEIQVGLIGLAIFLTLLGTAQTALLQGMRRIVDLGRVTILSALIGTIAGLAAVWFYGKSGLVWFVVIQPLVTILIAIRYTRRLPAPTVPRTKATEFWGVWLPMVKIGSVFMLGGLATTTTLLLVRGHITQELGLAAAGHFAASWGITMTYAGFLLGAMAADYYPRLAEIITDSGAATQLINDQAQIALAIGGPVLLLLIGLAPWVMALMYSEEFGAAAELLQWQTVGNVFKLASWPLAFSIVAAARSKTYFMVEVSFNLMFLSITWLLLPILGLRGTSIAFCAGYVIYFMIVNIVVYTSQRFRWGPLTLKLLVLHISFASIFLGIALKAPVFAAIASPLIAAATGLIGLRIVLQKVGPGGRVSRQFSNMYIKIGWPIRYEE